MVKILEVEVASDVDYLTVVAEHLIHGDGLVERARAAARVKQFYKVHRGDYLRYRTLEDPIGYIYGRTSIFKNNSILNLVLDLWILIFFQQRSGCIFRRIRGG